MYPDVKDLQIIIKAWNFKLETMRRNNIKFILGVLKINYRKQLIFK